MKSLLLYCILLAFSTVPIGAADSIDPYDQSKVPLEADSSDPKLAKIVLIAGKVSSKAGQHEYFAGCAMMMNWLKQNPGVFPVMARDGWPKNERIFEHAKSVVYYGDGGGNLPFIEPARWAILKTAMDSGAGFVLLHQAVDFPKGPDAEIKQWLGGVFLSDIGCRGHWNMEFSKFPDHPIMRGVTPFKAPGDGWLYNLHFADDAGFTPLVAGAVPDTSRTTRDAKTHAGRDEIIGWAYQRANGGRGFSFTGCDLHKNWGEESQRRLVINGILWTAKMEIPKGGAMVNLDPDDLRRNLDDKRTQAADAAKKKK
jgi:type 1 glutamine amidotransferase